MAAGTISAEHADVVASAVSNLSDEERRAVLDHDADLTDLATTSTPERFRRSVRSLIDEVTNNDGLEASAKQRAATSLQLGRDETTGMGWIRGQLDPESYQRVRRAIVAESARLCKDSNHRGRRRDQLDAIALVKLTTTATPTGGPRNRAELGVFTDLATLIDGRHADTVCEYADGTPIPVETMRRHACDAGVIPIVLGGDGMPLDVGRVERLATPEQRLGLRSMYRTCAVDECSTSFDECEIHHLLEWTDDLGPADLVNLLPICTTHHHRAHEGGWKLALNPVDRELLVHLPDGTLHSRCLPDLVAERLARDDAA